MRMLLSTVSTQPDLAMNESVMQGVTMKSRCEKIRNRIVQLGQILTGDLVLETVLPGIRCDTTGCIHFVAPAAVTFTQRP